MFHRGMWWFLLLLCVGVLLEWHQLHATLSISSIDEIWSLPSSSRVQISGVVRSLHYSGTALVFDLVNGGEITCYFRRPPPHFPLLNGDFLSLIARIDSTPRGKLCVVERVLSV
ncbi:MAG: hypothetical protein V1776_05695 [Candidatus Diapherotrites archaeon]